MIHIRLTNVIIERKGHSSTTKYKYYYPRLCNESDFTTDWERSWYHLTVEGSNANLYCIQNEDIHLFGTR